ncbi:MAG: hypothetical protein AAF959_06480 [Cyanobacteria bacterium P01_D01_bin.56]
MAQVLNLTLRSSGTPSSGVNLDLYALISFSESERGLSGLKYYPSAYLFEDDSYRIEGITETEDDLITSAVADPNTISWETEAFEADSGQWKRVDFPTYTLQKNPFDAPNSLLVSDATIEALRDEPSSSPEPEIYAYIVLSNDLNEVVVAKSNTLKVQLLPQYFM